MDIEKGSRAATRLVPWEKEVTLMRIGANHSDTARCSRPYRHHTPACDENGLQKFRESLKDWPKPSFRSLQLVRPVEGQEETTDA